MMFSIGCVDGNTYHSDHMPDAEMLDYLEEVDGRIGTGANKHIVVRTLEEARTLFTDMCKYDSRNDTQTINMTINGRNRYFNVVHIVWFQIDLDSDTKEIEK